MPIHAGYSSSFKTYSARYYNFSLPGFICFCINYMAGTYFTGTFYSKPGIVWMIMEFYVRYNCWPHFFKSRRENGEYSSTVFTTCNLFDCFYLLYRSFSIYVQLTDAFSHVYGFWPPKPPRKHNTIEFRVSKISFKNPITKKRFAIAIGRQSIKITRAAIITITTLHIFRFYTPLRR